MKFKLIILLLSITSLALAQQTYTLQGNISGPGEDHVAYASVAILKDSTMIKGLLSNDAGTFSAKLGQGKYKIKVSFMGYKTFTQTVNLNGDVTLNIILNKEGTALNEVKVVGRKPLVEQQIDRLVFNVENSIFGKGVNALELLNQTPRVEVSPDGSLKLIGKSSLSVMIDGRLVQGDMMKQRLSALRSDNIAKIEVITTPPAKYSAQGNSGIINIILKKDPMVGWLVNFSTSFRQRTFSAVDQSIGLNYKSKKFEWNFGASGFIDSKRYLSNNTYRSSAFNWDKANTRDATAHNLSLNTSINYKLNDNMEIGAIADVSFEKDNETGNTTSLFINPSNSHTDSLINSPANIGNHYNFTSVSAYYDYKLDDKGKTLSLTGSYFQKNMDNTRLVNSFINSSNPRSETINNNGNATYNGKSVNADFELPYKWMKLETGGALYFIENNSNNQTAFNSLAAPADIFDYEERTAAAYVSGSRDLNKKWSIKAGLRYENIYLKGTSLSLGQQNSSQYGELFPTGFIAFKPNANNTLSFAYSRRIEKPIFYYLNPYRIYIDSYSYTSGNPYLLPSFSQNLELSETYANNLTIAISRSVVTNGIDYVTLFATNTSQTVSMPENYLTQKNYNLDLSYTLPLNWVNSYNSLDVSYITANSNNNTVAIPDLNGFGAYYSTRNSVSLNKKKSTFFIINYTQRFPTTTGFYKFDSRSSVDVGLKFKAIKRKVQANILIADLFKNNYTNGTRQYVSVAQHISSYNDQRMLSVSLSYNFGNKKAAVNAKPVTTADQNRAIL